MQIDGASDNSKMMPLYIQIYDCLKRGIVDGDYPFGSRLPSRNTMAAEKNVSVITIKHAYELLCDEGYLESRERSGYYVVFREEDGFQASENIAGMKQKQNQRINSYSFPFSVLSKTMRRVISDYGEFILEKTHNKGSIELRDALRKYLARNRNIHVEADQIIIGSGAEYLYSLIVGLFGIHTIFALESPSYEKIEQVYRMAGVHCELLPIGTEGIESKALSATSANILHISPYRSFPSGVTASASKKY